MFGRLHLRTLSTLWIAAALGVGVLCSSMWFFSTRAWQDHLHRAYSSGVQTFYALENGQNVSGIKITQLMGFDLENAESGHFERVSGAPRPSYVTLLSLVDNVGDPTDSSGVKIAVVSDRLQYKVADITSGDHSSPALKFGDLTQLLATYCSDPLIYANLRNSGWIKIDGLTSGYSLRS